MDEACTDDDDDTKTGHCVEAKTGHCGEAKTDHCGEAKTGHCGEAKTCLLYTSPSPRDRQKSRMPSSA